MSVTNTTSIYLSNNIVGESSLYRLNEGNQGFLLFSFSSVNRAIDVGEKLANILGVKFTNYMTAEVEVRAIGQKGGLTETMSKKAEADSQDIVLKDTTKIAESDETPTSNKKKTRAKGLRELCTKLLADGKADEQIKEELTQAYITAGKDEKTARNNAASMMYNVRNSGK